MPILSVYPVCLLAADRCDRLFGALVGVRLLENQYWFGFKGQEWNDGNTWNENVSCRMMHLGKWAPVLYMRLRC